MDFDEKVFQIALSMLPGIGPVTSRKLIAEFGSAAAIFRQSKKNLLCFPLVNEAIVKAMRDPKLLQRAEEEFGFALSKDIRIVFYNETDYPKRLKECYDSPILLYSKGNVFPDKRRTIGIVGTRQSTDYGRMLTEKLVGALAGKNILVVSGLAYGIDIIAHRAATELNIPTIGVLAHGLDTVYPAVHRSVAKKMTENGGLLSDYPRGTKPDKENFPMRNRIVAGLCDALVVVESGESGGSMITAEFANNYNRDVFAYPGRVNDPFSAGCHKLIRTHKAALAESAEDILRAMSWDDETGNEKISKQGELPVGLQEDEQIIFRILQENDSVHADEIAALSGFSTGKTSTLLMQLEFAGFVKTLAGKRYALK